MRNIMLVGLGGFLGAIARYGLGGLVHRHIKGLLPFGSLTVNLVGSLVIGILMGLVVQRQLFAQETRLLLIVGFLGSFTTLSTVSYETFQMMHDGEWMVAIGNAAANIVIGIALVAVGWAAVRLIGGGGWS